MEGIQHEPIVNRETAAQEEPPPAATLDKDKLSAAPELPL
jgi:hypothetical protein